MTLAAAAAADLLRRHAQDHGEYPRRLVLDLWGSTTLRTGGEDLGLALVLLGVAPLWDAASHRVTGVEVLPLALLDRPRVDVTLRISGLFRDAFAAQITLFDQAVRAVAARDEAPDMNPLAGAGAAPVRVFGPAPGRYGAAVTEALAHGGWTDRAALGRAWLDASAAAYGGGLDGAPAPEALAARVAAADAFAHVQDQPGTDLLDGPDHAAHLGGFAAAAEHLGATPALYEADIADPAAPRARPVAQAIARATRARAANPAWIAGMMRHGAAGAIEMMRALDALHGFAATLPGRLDAQFDLLFDATLGDATVDAFLRAVNPPVRAAMQARFRDALRRDLWRPRRNAPAGMLDA